MVKCWFFMWFIQSTIIKLQPNCNSLFWERPVLADIFRKQLLHPFQISQHIYSQTAAHKFCANQVYWTCTVLSIQHPSPLMQLTPILLRLSSSPGRSIGRSHLIWPCLSGHSDLAKDGLLILTGPVLVLQSFWPHWSGGWEWAYDPNRAIKVLEQW